MFPLQGRTGPISFSEALRGDRDAGTNTKISAEINSANSIDLLAILEKYKVQIDYSNKCKCPFQFHKNGNERTASFIFNKEKNNFYCFGCQNGGGPVNFIALIQDISKQDAAKFILNNFQGQIKIIAANNDYQERLNIHLQFSLLIRNFISSNKDDKIAIKYAESITSIFDGLNTKHNLNIDGLKLIIEKLRIKLEEYECNTNNS